MNKIRDIIAGSLLMVAAAFGVAHGSGWYYNSVGKVPSTSFIGSATNKPTQIEFCMVSCSSGACTWALQKYASVTSGPIVSGHIYPVSVTASELIIPINQRFLNGVSQEAITGVTRTYCRYTK